MAVSIRRLGVEDIALFRGLVALFGAVFEEPTEPLSDAYIARLLREDAFVAFAALDSTGSDAELSVVGGATMRVWDAYLSESKHGYVYDLAVAESHRRMAIATRLIEACKKFAVEQGLSAMWVQAEADDEHAVAFYRSLAAEELEVAHFELLVQ